MKVWYVSKYGSLPEHSGSQRQYSISKFLSERFETTLIISKSNGYKQTFKFNYLYKEIFHSKLRVIVFNGPLISFGFSLKRIFSWALFEFNFFIFFLFSSKKSRPDILLVSSLSFFTLITGALIKALYNVKLVIEIRDIWPLTLVSFGRIKENGLVFKIMSFFEIWAYESADCIIGTMPRLDLHIDNSIKRNFNYCHIPMGYSKEQYLSIGKKVESINIPIIDFNNRFVIGYAGTIGVANLVDEIIAAAKILEGYSGIFFAIFGDGPLLSKYKFESSNMANIHFYGSINKYDVIPILSECDLLVSPINDSRIYDYGVSLNKWIDYMLSARPILASYSGYESMSNNFESIFFVDANRPDLLAEKILEISKIDVRTLNLLGQNGFDYAIKYHSYEFLSNKYVDLIKTL